MIGQTCNDTTQEVGQVLCLCLNKCFLEKNVKIVDTDKCLQKGRKVILVDNFLNSQTKHIVSPELKPLNSDFYQNDILSTREYQAHGAYSSNSRSSRPIRTPLNSINHASKYCIYKKFHYFGAHFTEIQGFAMKKMLKMS